MFADVNTQVESGAKLLRIEPAADQAAEPGVHGVRADLGALADAAAGDGDPAETAADALVAPRSLVLGYDVDEAGRQLRRLAAARAELPADDPRLLRPPPRWYSRPK